MENIDLIAASLSFLVSFLLLSTPLQTTRRYIQQQMSTSRLCLRTTLPLSSAPPRTSHTPAPSSLTSIPSLTAAAYAVLPPSYTFHAAASAPHHALSSRAIPKYLRKLMNSRSSENDLPISGGSACVCVQ
ncbi:hypothetical protein B0H13DRAFT_1982568, partial [Mycena leptocephala]